MFSDPVNDLSEAQSEFRNKNNTSEGFLLLVDDFEVGPSPFIFKLDEHCSVIRLEALTHSLYPDVRSDGNEHKYKPEISLQMPKNMKIEKLTDFVKYEDV